jgi:CheY-like chemotaxis protein
MEAMGRLAAGVAHDFNNVLTSILCATDLARMQAQDPARAADHLEMITRSAQRASRLTRQLLSWTRRQWASPEPLRWNDVLEGMAEMTSHLLGEDCRVETDLASDLPVVVADTGQLEQIVLNLVVNARDAIPQGGTIVLRTRRVAAPPPKALGAVSAASSETQSAAGWVVLEVEDSGVGMSESVQARAFEPLFTTKPEGKGTGLGLATVRRITEQYGGWVAIDSRPGEGTRMRVGLPARPDLQRGDAEPPAEQSAPRGGETLLLLEDDPPIRRLTAGLLKTLGYRVLTAASLREARALLSQPSPRIALLITDAILPDGSARDVLALLEEHDISVPVLLTTGYSEERLADLQSVVESLELLPEPYETTRLAQRVRRILDREYDPRRRTPPAGGSGPRGTDATGG